MFDHVGVAVSDLEASERFYRTVLEALGAEPTVANAGIVGWEDWAIGPTDADHPTTRHLHVGFRAADRAAVDAFWAAGTRIGASDAGQPGPRPIYGPGYYGAFLTDPDGNSIEAMVSDREPSVPAGCIDHLSLRVVSPQESRRFYSAIGLSAGLRISHERADHVQVAGADFSLSLVADGAPRTEHVHLAFAAQGNGAVRDFHAVALAAGYEDNGPPGERPVYHPGYYGAFVRDPDGHNVEVVNHRG